jgi:putative transposase
MEEILTLQSLGVRSAAYKTLRTTNPIENLTGSIARFARNVKCWKDGEMVWRWVAGALSDSEHRFRGISSPICAVAPRVAQQPQPQQKVA